MAAMTPTTFFDLPTEIRNEIYSLIAYHCDTNGIISPLSDKAAPQISIALLDGRRYSVEYQGLYGDLCYRYAKYQEREKLEAELFCETSNARSNHFCTVKCLRPPEGASQACRQMREEVLAIFYSVNQFHFEMCNFEVTDTAGLSTDQWSPVRWWRAIGDTNLRRITTFSLVGRPTNKYTEEPSLMFRYRHVGGEAVASVERLECLGWDIAKRRHINPPEDFEQALARHSLKMSSLQLTRFDAYRLQKWKRDGDFEASVRTHAQSIRESGVHVNALEKIISVLEPWNVEYLKDHISLGDDLVVGKVKEGRGELALRWNPCIDY